MDEKMIVKIIKNRLTFLKAERDAMTEHTGTYFGLKARINELALLLYMIDHG